MMMLLSAIGSRKGCAGKITLGISGATVGTVGDGSLSSDRVIWSGYNASTADTQVTTITSGSSHDLIVEMIQTGGDPSVSMFSKVVIEDGDGTARSFATVGGGVTYTYFSGPGIARWSWGSGSDRVFGTGDSGEVHPYAVVT